MRVDSGYKADRLSMPIIDEPADSFRIAQPPQGAFFGRRKGHKLRSHQTQLIAELLPRLALDLTTPTPADLATLFGPNAVQDVRIEIGFGGGEHLIAEALAYPATGFIGVEPYVNGMAKILAQIEMHQIANIRLLAGDAAELLTWAAPRSVQRIDLIHPDPWPKRRHWKRRFVQDSTIHQMVRVLRSDGEFRFVSDIDHYTAWALDHFARTDDFSWTAMRANDWRKPWQGYTMTRYGKKAEREGRRATYLVFQRTM
jgi:tRNA (guanine-N7-)-methyltransferase